MGKPSPGLYRESTGFDTAPLCVGFFHMTSLKGAEILDSMMLRYKEAWLNIDHDGIHLPFLVDWGFSFIFVLQVETRIHPTYG